MINSILKNSSPVTRLLEISNWDKRLPSLKIHIAASILDISTRSLLTVTNFLGQAGLDPENFLREVAVELRISLTTSQGVQNDEILSPFKKRKLNNWKQLLRKFGDANTTCTDNFGTEVRNYLAMPINNEALLLDALDWWKLHYGQFPLLAKLARCLFSISATSAAIERVWSSSGLTITNRRSTLGPRKF